LLLQGTTNNLLAPIAAPCSSDPCRAQPELALEDGGINLAFFSWQRGPRWRYDAPRPSCINSHLIIDTILLFSRVPRSNFPTLVRGLSNLCDLTDDTHVWRKQLVTPNRASAVCNSLRAPVTQAAISWISSTGFTSETNSALLFSSNYRLSVLAVHVDVTGSRLPFSHFLIFSVVFFLVFFSFSFSFLLF
jgi:hypothetical protein